MLDYYDNIDTIINGGLGYRAITARFSKSRTFSNLLQSKGVNIGILSVSVLKRAACHSIYSTFRGEYEAQ